MPALVVPAFALTWWAACYLVGRDPARTVLWRAGAALGAFAAGVAAWAVAPGSAAAQILICVPAVFWAGAAVALLPRTLPERPQINLGWMVLAVLFVGVLVPLPSAGRLVVLAPLVGGLVLLWRFRDQIQPVMLPAALSVVAGLYAIGLVVLLLPINLAAPGLVLSAMALDLLMLGFLVAVADALEVGERLRPDLLRAVVGAGVGAVVVGGPAALTMVAAPGHRWAVVLQFLLVGVVMTVFGAIGPIRRGLDSFVFRHDERLRHDRVALLLAADALPRRRPRQRLITTSEQDFLRFTRHALENYADLGRLIRSPLADLPVVDRRLTGRAVEPPLARAIELQGVLREGVDRLRPAGSFDTTDEWRFYNAVHFCWVLGLDPYARRSRTEGLDRDARRAFDWMRGYVPRRTLRRWQQEAATIVARRLWGELVKTDPRWLTRVSPPTTRST
ncbi:MAG: hypothetical protein ABW046_08220 [Actinoplanes sp.]